MGREMSIDVETIDPAEIAYRDKRIAELKTENERLLIELDDISKQAAKELTGEAIQARVKITMEIINAARKDK